MSRTEANGRQSISKGLRYAILDRDRHTCQYCGRTAPEARLTIDHIVPVSAGGDNEHTNLVAACVDCNAGKGAKLSLRPVENAELAARLASIKERRRLLKATAKAEKELRDATEERTWTVARHWIKIFGREPKENEQWSINSNFFATLSYALGWLPAQEITSLMDVVGRKWSLGPIKSEADAIKYFCGCIRNIRQEREAIEQGGPNP